VRLTGKDHLDVERAIYIDFESLKEDPRRPGLLGVLTAGNPDRFEQLLLAPALRRAAEAKLHCRAVALPEAIAQIVERAEREDRLIVGWSLFERTVVEESELSALLKAPGDSPIGAHLNRWVPPSQQPFS
jgi:hypothetical protein